MADNVKNVTILKLGKLIERAKIYIGRSVLLEEKKIEGANRLRKRLKGELKFLNELNEGSILLKPSHLNSTNLSHLGGVLDVIEDIQDDVTAILKTITWSPMVGGHECSTLIIDVITSQSWLKVVARNPIALHKSWQGEGNFGEKSIEVQAKEYLEARDQHQINYMSPKIIFVFTQGSTETLVECLRKLEIIVKGIIIPDPGCESLRNPELKNLKRELHIEAASFTCSKVNLDVTALIALVSALTNGSCYYKFEEQVLSDQAESEREHPVLPKLDTLLEGKDLYACSSAISSFQKILATLGGPNEKQRAIGLLSRITEVPDNPSERIQNLTPSAKIKPRPMVVFGTGDMIQAITVSSNFSFVRAAKEQGVELSVFVHEPRALTESKEQCATVVQDEQ